MNTLDDAALILQFVKRESTLASNQSLRIEPAFDSVQLLAKRGGLLASIKTNQNITAASVRRGSEYWNLIHQILVSNQFVPIEPSAKSEFLQYEQRQIPSGYKLNCTESRFLWKEWWTRVRNSNRNNIQTDLLIFCRNTWYPVREVVCSQGSLFVTTLVSEFIYQGSELIVWLSKEQSDMGEQATPSPVATQSQSTEPPKPVFRQTPGKTAFVGRDIPPSSPPIAPPTPNGTDKEKQGNTAMRPDLREVLKFRQGKLYVTTPIGEVVIEGNNLKFWLNDEEPAPPKTVDISSYRDRDAQAVNL